MKKYCIYFFVASILLLGSYCSKEKDIKQMKKSGSPTMEQIFKKNIYALNGTLISSDTLQNLVVIAPNGDLVINDISYTLTEVLSITHALYTSNQNNNYKYCFSIQNGELWKHFLSKEILLAAIPLIDDTETNKWGRAINRCMNSTVAPIYATSRIAMRPIPGHEDYLKTDAEIKIFLQDIANGACSRSFFAKKSIPVVVEESSDEIVIDRLNNTITICYMELHNSKAPIKTQKQFKIIGIVNDNTCLGIYVDPTDGVIKESLLVFVQSQIAESVVSIGAPLIKDYNNLSNEEQSSCLGAITERLFHVRVAGKFTAVQ